MQAHTPYLCRGILLVVCTVVLPSRSVCLADTPPSSPGSAVPAPQMDEVLVKEGYRTADMLQRGGDLSGALSVLRATHERVKTPVLLWPIAQLSLKLQRPIEGLQALAEYAERVPPQEMEPGRQMPDVARLKEALLGQVARLTVMTDEPGALVLVDGREHGRAPLPGPIELDPGRRHVEARGSRTVAQEVSLWPGRETQMWLRLKTPPPRPRRSLAVAKWTLAGIGMAGLIAGGVTWGEDGHNPTTDLRTPGVAILSAGAGLIAASVVLFAIDKQ